MRPKPWTRSDDQYIREHYVSDGAHACAAALGRTWSAITHRARRLHVVRVRRWSWRDDLRLRGLWGVHPISAIASMMQRTEESIYWRARQLELGLGCPQGHETLSEASRRTGYATSSLRMILNWAHVRIERAWTRPSPKPKQGNRLRWVVEPTDVDEAVARWLETETIASAAKRRGLDCSTLHRLIEAAARSGDSRIPPKPAFRRHWRIPSAVIDALVRERNARVDAKESLKDAAKRVGVTPATLAAWLRAAGLSYSRESGVLPSDVDRVVAVKRQQPGCKAWLTKGRVGVERRVAA